MRRGGLPAAIPVWISQSSRPTWAHRIPGPDNGFGSPTAVLETFECAQPCTPCAAPQPRAALRVSASTRAVLRVVRGRVGVLNRRVGVTRAHAVLVPIRSTPHVLPARVKLERSTVPAGRRAPYLVRGVRCRCSLPTVVISSPTGASTTTSPTVHHADY